MSALEESVLNFNRKAMHDLRSGQTEQASFLLSEALSSLSTLKTSYLKHKLLAICYNNLGYFYKHKGEYTQSVKYLTRALDHESHTGEEWELVAVTLLNFSSVLSTVGDHEGALQHCLRAVKVLKSSGKEELANSIVLAYHNAGI